MKNKMKLFILLSLVLLVSVFSCSDMMAVYLNSDGGGETSDAAEAAAALTEDDFTFTGSDSRTSVTADFTLPVEGSVAGTTISWASDNESVITIAADGTATVTQPSGSNVTVTLTATITDSEGNTTTKTFEVTVVAVSPFVPSTGMSAVMVLGQDDPNTVAFVAASDTTFGADYYGMVIAGDALFISGYPDRRALGWTSLPTTNKQAADIVIGQPDFTTTTTGTTAQKFSEAWGIASDGEKLLIADNGNNRVLIYNSIPSTSNPVADLVIGAADLTSVGGGGAAADQLNGPGGLFVTPDNKLLVVDRGNHRVLVFNTIPTANDASADLVIGQPDFTTVTNGITDSKLEYPGSVWSDGTRLVIADTGNNRVLIWNTFPTTDGEAADVVVGQADMTSNTVNQGGGATPAANTLYSPDAAIVGVDGKLYIADTFNNRILVFNTIPSANDASADTVIGQADFVTGTSGTTADRLSNPRKMLEHDSALWVIDASNRRVLKYE